MKLCISTLVRSLPLLLLLWSPLLANGQEPELSGEPWDRCKKDMWVEDKMGRIWIEPEHIEFKEIDPRWDLVKIDGKKMIVYDKDNDWGGIWGHRENPSLCYPVRFRTKGLFWLQVRNWNYANTEHNDVWSQFRATNWTLFPRFADLNNPEESISIGGFEKLYRNQAPQTLNWDTYHVDFNPHRIYINITTTPYETAVCFRGRSTKFGIEAIRIRNINVVDFTNRFEDETFECQDLKETTFSPATGAPATTAPSLSPVSLAPSLSPATQTPTLSPATQTPTLTPTTLSPTTVAPTVSPVTASPTTSPTTKSPTTRSPVTCAPSSSPTSSPSTSSPTTKSPVTEAPTTISPTTEAPTTGTPTTSSPTTLTPTTSSPTTSSPTTSQPTTLTPTTSSPVTGSPTTQSPTTQSPVTQSPTTLSPVTSAPTTEAPTCSPTTLSPVTSAPSTSPTTATPTTASPTTCSPTTMTPTALATQVLTSEVEFPSANMESADEETEDEFREQTLNALSEYLGIDRVLIQITKLTRTPVTVVEFEIMAPDEKSATSAREANPIDVFKEPHYNTTQFGEPTPLPDDDESDFVLSQGQLIGVAVGGFFLLVGIIALLVYCCGCCCCAGAGKKEKKSSGSSSVEINKATTAGELKERGGEGTGSASKETSPLSPKPPTEAKEAGGMQVV